MDFSKIMLSVTLAFVTIHAKHERRCAIDIGSGWIKMQMAVVETETNQVVQLLDKPFLKHVPLGNYYAQDKKLSVVIQQQAITAFDEILHLCAEHKIEKVGGVATAVFRKAGESGMALFNALQYHAQKIFGFQNVTLRIINQELEGQLGFMTAASLLPEIDSDSLISWDSGNASFQIVMQDTSNLSGYFVFEGNIGNALAAKMFVQQVRKQNYTTTNPINPITTYEINKFIEVLTNTLTFPNTLVDTIKNKNMHIIGIGNKTSMFAVAAYATGKNTFTVEDVHSIIQKYAALTNDNPALQNLDTIETESVITRLILLYVVMQKLGIKQVLYKHSIGNTLGILSSYYFWN